MKAAFATRESCPPTYDSQPRVHALEDYRNRLSSALQIDSNSRLKASAAWFDVEVAPRQPALPEAWDARSLDDESISEELQKLKFKRRGPLTPRNLSTSRVRSVRNSRLRPQARSTAADATPDASRPLGVQAGEFLSAEQEARLLSKWQEWHRIQRVAPPFSGSAEEHRRAWAKAANMSESELSQCERHGPLAAHLLLASVERLLYKISLRYAQMGTDIEDVLAEARNLWLDAAAQCNPGKARLTSFGTMVLKQRLPRVVDRQRSLLDQPPSALYDELRVSRVRQDLVASLAREPSIAEIANKAGMARPTVRHVLERIKTTISLDSPAVPASVNDAEEGTMGDNLAGSMATDVSEGLTPYLRPEMEETLNYLMDKNIKNDEEREVCKQYYGFNGRSRPLRELSAMHDCSVETVRKRLIKARAHLNKNGDVEKYLGPYLEEGGLREHALEVPSQISNLSESSNNLD